MRAIIKGLFVLLGLQLAGVATAGVVSPGSCAAYDGKLTSYVLIGVDMPVIIPINHNLSQDGLCAAADFNGDGKLDVLFQANTGERASGVYFADVNGKLSVGNFSAFNTDLGVSWSANDSNLYVLDMNGDGRADVMVESHSASGNSAVLYAAVDGSVSGSVAALWNVEAYSATPPLVAGAINGTFEVNSAGAATYSLPIDVPPGIAGLAPEITLNYNSSSGNGLLGVGWNLGGLSAISRCPRTIDQDGVAGEIRYDSTDRFCMDGQRLVAVNGTYGASGTEYRTEIETYARIFSYGNRKGPEFFVVKHKDGHTSYYGKDDQSKVIHSGIDAILGWAVNRVEDRLGNYMAYKYNQNREFGDFSIHRIEYTGHGNQESARFVEFEYADRPDKMTMYSGGVKFRSSVRLNSINTYIYDGIVSRNKTLVSRYGLAYTTEDTNAVRSLLRSVTKCSPSECLTPATFSWLGEEVRPTLTFDTQGVPALDYWQINGEHYWQGDFDGDGRGDLAVWRGDLLMRLSRSGAGGKLTFDERYWNSNFNNLQDCGRHTHTRVGDVNGDGKSDLLQLSTGGIAAHVSSGSDFVASCWSRSTAHIAPQDSESEFQLENFLVGDFDGDARSDVVVIVSQIDVNVRKWTLVYHRSTGSTFETQSFDLNTVGVPYPSAWHWAGDFDGDGKLEIAIRLNSPDSINKLAVIGLRDGKFVEEFRGGPSPWGEGSDWVWATDFNGDGITDIASGHNGEIFMKYSTGTGFAFKSLAFSGNWGIGSLKSSLGDFNGDGLVDILLPVDKTSANLLVNVGGEFVERNTLISTSVPSLGSFGWGDPNEGSVLASDFTGDGVTDLLVGWESGSKQVVVRTIAPRENEGAELRNIRAGRPNTIVEIGSPSTGGTKIEYGPLTDPSIHRSLAGSRTVTYPYVELAVPQFVVKRYTSFVPSASGTYENSVRFNYSGALIHATGRGPLGFAEVKETHEARDVVTLRQFHQIVPSPDFWKAGLIERTSKTFSRAGSPHDEVIYSYAKVNSDGGRPFYYAESTTHKTYAADSDYRLLSTSTTELKEVDNYGHPHRTEEVTVQHDTGDTYRNDSTFDYHSADRLNWIVGQLRQSTVSTDVPGPNGARLTTNRVSQFEYYSGTGLVREEIKAANDSALRTVTRWSYDKFGNETSVTADAIGAKPRRIIKQYTEDGYFPLYTTNAFGHTETTVYDPRFGLVVTVTSPNGLTTYNEYDGFGRIVVATGPDSNQIRTTRERLGGGFAKLKTKVDGGSTSYSLTDSLGRVVRESTLAPSGQFSIVRTEYDRYSRVIGESLPAFGSREDADPIATWKCSIYDDFDRVVKRAIVINANSCNTAASAPMAQQIIYADYETTVHTFDTASGTETKRELRNALGQNIRITDGAGKHAFLYYNGIGQLVESIDSDGKKTTFEYDGLGRKRVHFDGDMGRWSYNYNPFDDVTLQTDPNGNQISMDYDAAGRLITRIDRLAKSGGGFEETRSTWEYDQGPMAIGKESAAIGQDYRAETYYDGLGRVAKVVTQIEGETYTVESLYDQFGRLFRTYYPAAKGDGALIVEQRYFNNGDLKSVVDALTGKLFWERVSVFADGGNERERYGNGAVTVRTQDPKYLRLATLRSTRSDGTSVQDLKYTFDSVGNLTERRDIRQGLWETLGYDARHRLTSVSRNGSAASNYDYFDNGNIRSKSDFGTDFRYESNRPHAVTSVYNAAGQVGKYEYDNNGNMIKRTRGGVITTMRYSAFNKPLEISSGNEYARYKYDTNRMRMRQDTADGYTVYLNLSASGQTLFEKAVVDGLATTKLSVAGGKAIVVVEQQSAGEVKRKMHYMLNDHLGSVDAVMVHDGYRAALDGEDNRLYTEYLSFEAFGKRRDAKNWNPDGAATLTALSTDRGFTGHVQLDSLGLIHMNGRIYDPELGRFLTPDSVIDEPTNMQAWNRYSYVTNNPLSYSDPTGHIRGWLRKNPRFATILSVVIMAIPAAQPYAIAIQGFAAGYIASGGDVRAGMIGMVAAGAFYGIGSTFGETSFAQGQVGSHIGKSVVHGIASGMETKANGGKFAHGFSSGAVTQAMSPVIRMAPRGARIIVAAVVGGTASVASGGKFGSGAVTSSFLWAFNHNGHDLEEQYKTDYEVLREAPDNLDYRLSQREALASIDMAIKSNDAERTQIELAGMIYSAYLPAKLILDVATIQVGTGKYAFEWVIGKAGSKLVTNGMSGIKFYKNNIQHLEMNSYVGSRLREYRFEVQNRLNAARSAYSNLDGLRQGALQRYLWVSH